MESSTNILSRLPMLHTLEYQKAQACISETMGDSEKLHTTRVPSQISPNKNSTPPLAVVQQALTALDEGQLTESQEADLHKGLMHASQTLLVQEGCTTRHPFTFDNKTWNLNALQLTCLSAALNIEKFSSTWHDVNGYLHALDQKRSLNPTAFSNNIAKVTDTHENFQVSQLPLSRVEQSMAKAVVDTFPPDMRGTMFGIDAVLIGRKTFKKVMEKAALQLEFPEVLKQFHVAAKNCPGLRLALATQPSLAYALLFPGKRVQPASVPPDYLEQVTMKVVPASWNRLANTSDPRISTPYALEQIMGRVFRNMKTFGCRNSAPIPSCPDIPCPAHSIVKINGHPAEVHANVVNDNGTGRLIAAMQPVTDERCAPVLPANLSAHEQTNVAKFLSMVAGQEKPAILDLRSASDLDSGKGIDYCPQQEGQTHLFDDVSITTTRLENMPPDLKSLTVQIRVGNNPPVELKVAQFRGWPDHDVVGADTLRRLGDLVCQDQHAGASVVTHCKAGLGRTGTVLAYAGLHQRLIAESGAAALFVGPDPSKPSAQKVIEHVTAEVLRGRIQRGPRFVDTVEQFTLLGTTLFEDIQNWKNDKASPVPAAHLDTVSSQAPTNVQSRQPEITPATLPTATPEIEPALDQAKAVTTPQVWAENCTQKVPDMLGSKQMVSLHANRIALVPGHVFTLAQEPKNEDSKWQYLHSLFDQGSDVIEFVSDMNRLARFTDIPKTSGLNVLCPLVLDAYQNPGKYDGTPEAYAGKFRINSVHQPVENQNKNGCMAYTYQFDVTDMETGLEKSIRHVQIYSEFIDKRISTIQLKAMLKLSDQCGLNQDNLWLSSAKGTGRPSAWLMARHIDDAIHANKMTKRNCRGLIDSWIKTGREQHGPQFVHSRAQKEELVQLALDLLKNKKSTRNQEPPANRQLLFKRSKTFGQRISSFFDLLGWIKKHLHLGKNRLPMNTAATTTQSPPQPVSTNPPW